MNNLNDILLRWEKTKLLDGLREENKLLMACIFENQYHLNKQKEKDQSTVAWRRSSIPLLRRVIAGLLDDNINVISEITDSFNGYISLDSDLKWDMYAEENRCYWKHSSVCNIDWECKYIVEFSEKIVKAIKDFMFENNYKTFKFHAIDWINNNNEEGQIVFYGEFKKGIE